LDFPTPDRLPVLPYLTGVVMTKIENTGTPLNELTVDALVVGVTKGNKLTKQGAQVDKALGGGLASHLERIRFKGKVGESAIVPTFGKTNAGVILAVGLGESRVTPNEVRRAAGAAARQTSSFETIGFDLPDGSGARQAAVEGFLLGAYSFNRYKSEGHKRPDQTIFLASPGKKSQEEERGRAVADSVTWARDLVNEPAGVRGPAGFAEMAVKRAENAGLKTELLDVKELRKRGMNGILSVGQGSTSPPRFLTLTYAPRGAKGFVGVIGKGITFDSGGLSLKTAEGMETMKTDCSGAAAAIAAITALPELKPKIKVVAAIPLAENMPSGNAIKPGDIIRHYGGRTSEVLNTDAEGRLVLADALAWMAEQKPDAMIDLATLTGGIVVALGKKTTGFFSNNARLTREIRDAATRTGEAVWEMPLLDELRKEIDSDVADVKNTGGRAGSPIFGALFLRDFVGDTPWAHLDIAGTARADKDEHHIGKGATGVGTRLVIDWIESRAGK
jgi:leucyl aminopeptidase